MVDFSSDSTRTAPRHVPTGTYAKGSLLEDTARLHNRRGRLRGIYQSRLLTRQGPAFARGPLVTRSARSSPTVPYFALQDPRSLNTSVLCVSSKPRDDLLFFFFLDPNLGSDPTYTNPLIASRSVFLVLVLDETRGILPIWSKDRSTITRRRRISRK